MSNQNREAVGDWLIVGGAVALLISLFLTWSHQLSPSYLALFGRSDLLRGVPHDPTAWQVYSVADVVLGLLSVGLVAVALIGDRVVRIAATVSALAALGFTLHALIDPPSNGAANIFRPDLAVPRYLSLSPGAGAGETVAIIGLLVALAGLALSFTAD